MTTAAPLSAVLTYIDTQFDKLDVGAFETRKAAIEVACSVAAGPDPARRDALIRACIEAGLYTSPYQTLADDLRRVIAEVTHE